MNEIRSGGFPAADHTVPVYEEPFPIHAWRELVAGRHSARRFTAKPVPDDWIIEMLTEARRAPSGANLQPGEFIRVERAARQKLTERLIEAYRNGQPAREDYTYFPDPMPMGLRRRQVAAAQALYGALRIERGDESARRTQFENNFRFFDAPVALIATIDARMGSGCFMDLGMCLYGLMLAAAARGLGSCAIGALASYPDVMRDALGFDESECVVCGVAIGYSDHDSQENSVRTSRRNVSDFLRVVT